MNDTDIKDEPFPPAPNLADLESVPTRTELLMEIDRLAAEVEDKKLWIADYRKKRTDEVNRALRAERKCGELRNEVLRAFRAGWTMYADSSLGPRILDQMKEAYNHWESQKDK